MTHCPYCQTEVEDNPRAETSHMSTFHPDIVAARLREAGFSEGEITRTHIDRIRKALADFEFYGTIADRETREEMRRAVLVEIEVELRPLREANGL